MRKVFVYSIQLRDLSRVLPMCKETCPNSDFTVICEKTPQRYGFEMLLEMVKKDDIVFISAMQALRDSIYSDSIIEKIRQLHDRGVILKVGLQPSFSYQEFEDWYKVQKEFEDWEGVFRCHFEVNDNDIDELDMETEIPGISYHCYDYNCYYYLLDLS